MKLVTAIIKPFKLEDVKAALEEKGIGRPSTYSSIMSSLRERYLWSKRGDRALIPTVTAFAVDAVMET